MVEFNRGLFHRCICLSDHRMVSKHQSTKFVQRSETHRRFELSPWVERHVRRSGDRGSKQCDRIYKIDLCASYSKVRPCQFGFGAGQLKATLFTNSDLNFDAVPKILHQGKIRSGLFNLMLPAKCFIKGVLYIGCNGELFAVTLKALTHLSKISDPASQATFTRNLNHLRTRIMLQ